MSHKFPKLFTTNKAGKTQEWQIHVEDHKTYSLIKTEYGLVDGKKTQAEVKITQGKNLGKANETTHFTQAVSEAQSKWNSKKDKDYKERHKEYRPKEHPNELSDKERPKEENKASEKKKNHEIFLPMLAFDYHKRGHDVTFPAYIQPKLDGVRAIYNTTTHAFQSRTGKKFGHLQHITDEISNLNLLLDGELYSDTLTFQEITGSANKKKKLSNEDLEKQKEISYNVYDVIAPGNYTERLNLLKGLFKNNKFKYTKLVETKVIKKPEELEAKHDDYIKEGYEGMIIRNFEGEYALKNRSKNLQKYKKFDDDEFEIIDFTEGVGKEAGLVLWINRTKDGKTFTARPKGTHEERKKLFENAKKYIGKMLTVRYFGYTDDKIPRFPVGITIRDYE